MFSARLKSRTRPRRWRSSGMWPTPASSSSRGDSRVRSRPPIRIWPSFGLRKPKEGHIRIGGRDLTRESPRELLDAGVGHIPEDRQRRGLVLDFNLAENIALHDYRKAPESKFGWLFPKRLIARGLGRFPIRSEEHTSELQ